MRADDGRSSIARDPRGDPSRGVPLGELQEQTETAPLARADRSRGRGTLRDLEATFATSAGNNIARWLTALPPNTLNAAAYRRLLQDFARRFKLSGIDSTASRSLNGSAPARSSRSHKAMEREMRASCVSPTVPGSGRPAVTLVGKGMRFDTGGTNPQGASRHARHAHRHGGERGGGGQRCARCGRCGSPLAVDCWLAITENRIGPLAYKPQDVVRAQNGTTIQVIHTDAEGRMVLADALSLAAARSRRDHRLRDAYGRLCLCIHRALQRRVHQSPGGARAIESAGVEWRTRVVLSHGQGFRLGFGERRRGCTAMLPSIRRAITSWRHAS